jgi:ABC-type transport system involved in multi-copper enzyme maturation permease subunit
MAMAHASITRSGPDRRVSLREAARFGENLYRSLTWIELTWILLAAPAATAGAICLDKARGTLDHMLATDLSNAEIVLGKLGVRLIPVLGLIACTIPILAMAGLLGGIDPMAILGLSLVAIGSAVLGGALAMALSVYGRKTHEVVMMAYVVLLLWTLTPHLVWAVLYIQTSGFRRAGPWGILFAWLEGWNPYYLALAPYDTLRRVDVWSYLKFLAGCLAASATLVALATARVRRVALQQAGRPAAGRRRRWLRAWLPSPSMDRNPVAWREWHRARPSPMMWIVRGLYGAAGLLWVALSVGVARSGGAGEESVVSVLDMIQVSIGLVFLGVAAAAGLAEERARGSLDVLLSTPMPTRAILAGRWWGGFRRAVGVAIWPAAIAVPLAARSGYWGGYVLLIGMVLAHAAAIISLGLMIAAWIGRPGRAIAACVCVVVLSWIGWPILVGLAFNGPGGRKLAQALGFGVPPAGVLYATMAVSASGRIAPDVDRSDVFVWTFSWIAALTSVAAVLFAATLATFDGCLGRIPDEGMRRPSPPRRGRSSLSAAELLAMMPSSDEQEPSGIREVL